MNPLSASPAAPSWSRKPLDLKLRQLEAFAAIAETGSISRAAALLHTAQPPLSRQLAALEKHLGVSLFARGNKGMTLTEAGARVYRQVTPILESLQVLEERVQEEREGTGGRLALGCVYSCAPMALGVVKKFHALRPRVELFLRQGTPEDLLTELKQARLHVLFLRDHAVRMPGYRKRILGEDPLELVMIRETDPAPGQDVVPLEALRSAPLCLLPREDPWNYTDQLTFACRAAGFEPVTVCHCYDTPMAMQLVRSGLGISFLPRSIVANQSSSAVFAKPVAGIDAVSRPTLLWSGDPSLPASVRGFLDLVAEEGAAPTGGT